MVRVGQVMAPWGAGGERMTNDQNEAAKDTAPQAEPVDYFEQNVALVEKMSSAVGENCVCKANWRVANKGEAARGWKGRLSLQVEVSSGMEHIDDVLKLINKGAVVMGMLTRSLRKERARAEAAERRAEAAEAEVVRLRAAMESRELDREAHDLFEQADTADEHDTPRGRKRARRLREAAEAALVQAGALMARAEGDVAAAAAGGSAAVARVAEAEVARLAAEVTQARADALVLAGLTGHTALELIPEGSALDVALDAAIAHAETISDDEVIAIIRRTLGGAQ